jgi:hypothetical protein
VLTIIYLLLIGPGDYFFLSRLNLPRQVTWVSFPLVAVGVIAVAWGFDRQAHGRQTKLNQVEIIDIDLAHQQARGTAWMHLYSPRTRQFDLKLVLPSGGEMATGAMGWLVWQGLPGNALGGLESRQPALYSSEPYAISVRGEPQMEGLTVQVASSRSLSAGWWAKTNLPAARGLTIDRYGLLAGEFSSPLPMALSECLLAHGEKLYRLRTIEPGERVRMDDLAPLDLEARLQQRHIEQTKDVSTPWEQDSIDVPRIVQMLMFHDAAHGSTYTGLTHRYQSRIDFSQHVHLGEAILVGRAREAATRLMDGDVAAAEEVSFWTWYRVVLPVDSSRESGIGSRE